MINKTLSYLDFIKLLDLLKQYISTLFSSQLIDTLRPLQTIEEITERQDRIEATIEIIKWDGKIPLAGIPDIRDVVKRISIEDAILDIYECLSIGYFLKICNEIVVFLKKAHNKKSSIVDTTEKIKPLQQVYIKIFKTINHEGFIEDSASYELSKIRADLFIQKERIRKQLEKIMERDEVQSILQDSYISLRNGRYVIPLKPNFNQILQGIVHDYSHSLKTSFVEPIECVELNNTLNILKNEESEEEKKILKDLTTFIRKHIGEIEINLEKITELDFYHALALFSIAFNCIRPDVNIQNIMEIKKAINPFILLTRKDRTIPIDIFFEKEKQVMIISGPNAGGKTAALKTIGLLSLMAQCGLFIPASEKPAIPYFSNVFAIIGDEQDISMELSSFSAHIQAIKDVFEVSKGGELILIDEIGSNTDPQEAGALSMAIIDGFIEKGCKVIVTTHLNLLKAYGHVKPFAINVATAFDSDAIKPMYNLLYGIAGYSNAINIARNLNLPPGIIEKSYEYIGKHEYLLNDLIISLESGKRKIDEELKETVRLKEELRKRLSLLKEKKNEYIKKLEEKFNGRLIAFEKELKEIEKELAKKERLSIKKSKERIVALRKKFIKSATPSIGEISVGDYVRVRTLGTKGYVVDIDKGTDMYEVVIGNVRTKINREFIDKVELDIKQPGGNGGRVKIDLEPIEVLQINLMGMRVEEALKELDKFIDRAVVQGILKVRVLHGIGTGKLMSAIRNHLSGTGYVKNLKQDESNTGITIVELL